MALYSELLRQAWLEHKAPKADDAPTVVSTFAGAGGSTLGYSMAGYREVMAVEWEDHAADCYRRNFPHVNLFHGDIAKLDTSSLGMEPGELDVLDGSPPCQGFSPSGDRDVRDPRNHLFLEFVRLINDWQPKVFVMENVPAMATGGTRPLFLAILRTLREAGYRVEARVVDASLLGVPQKRKRMIFIGVRDDLGIDPKYPKPHRRVFTVRDAIFDIPLTKLGHGSLPRGQMADMVRYIPQGKHAGQVLTSVGKKERNFNLNRLRADAPSTTIIKTSGAGCGQLHPTKHRFITSGEASRLQSFPDEYDWGHSEYPRIIARLGNSVPPLMMREIAKTIRTDILERASETVRG